MARAKGPGRPPRAGKRAALARFELRLTADEMKRWTARAERQGVSLAELVRAAVEEALAKG